MLFPPPANDDDHKNKFSDKVLPPMHSDASSAGGSANDGLSADAPQGEELFNHVLHCLDQGSSRAEVRKQLIAFGYSHAEAEDVVEAVAVWRRQNPAAQSIVHQPSSGSGNANMWLGGVICLIGLAVTIGSCLAAGHGGGGVIAYGADHLGRRPILPWFVPIESRVGPRHHATHPP